jgi:hypothetical protein
MESYFIAETVKYLFLLFHQSSAISDFYVLSTEGHPFPVLPRHPPGRYDAPSFEERVFQDATGPELKACSSACHRLSRSEARAQVCCLCKICSADMLLL